MNREQAENSRVKPPCGGGYCPLCGAIERTCKIIEWYEARDRHEIGNNRVKFSCGDFGTCHDKFCPECGAKVVGESEVSMTRADRLLAELNNDRRINKQLKMANALLRKSEAAKIERIEELEELARDLHADLMEYGCTPNAHRANYKPRFEALGIEVDE